MFESLRCQKEKQRKSSQIGQAVPVNGERAQLQCNGVNLGVIQHEPDCALLQALLGIVKPLSLDKLIQAQTRVCSLGSHLE
jgi:hypothetical protein